MTENKFIRVEEDDPNRCQSVDDRGQCIYKAVEGGTCCLRHGGNRQQGSLQAAGLKNYRLTQWKAQADEQANSSGLKSLRDEIAILRVLMQERLNRCTDATELMLASGPLSDLVMKIERVVTSCNKLEKSMSMMLDKQALLQFAGEAVSIITEELAFLENPEPVLEMIADRLIQTLSGDE